MKFDAIEALLFKNEYKVTFSDTDPGGIVFFANFFKFAHIAYEQFFESLNLKTNYFFNDEIVIPIVNSSADFYSPVRFGDVLTCKLELSDIGNTSFIIKYKLSVVDKTVAEVITKHVVVSKVDFKKTPIPNELKEKLIKHLA